MTDDKLQDEMLQQLREVEGQLDWYRRMNNAWRRYLHWNKLGMAICVVEMGVIIYDMTLPVYLYLWWPWVVCWALSLIGRNIPKREAIALRRQDVDRAQEASDENYKLLTGEERHG